MIKSLGIGFPYIATLPADLYRSGLLDFVEVTPETVCRQRAIGGSVAIEIVPDQLDTARETCAGLPIVVHGVELSIGSAQGFAAMVTAMMFRRRLRPRSTALVTRGTTAAMLNAMISEAET